MSRLIVATRNPGKLAEIRSRIEGMGYSVSSLAEIDIDVRVEEDQNTFEGNARKKALAVLEATGFTSLADDSGLEVDALNGRPGVYSARYGGEGLSDEDRYELLLEELSDMPVEKRSARFKSAIAFAESDGTLEIFFGVFEGRIGFSPAGFHGFGYDPVFIPNGYDCTLAELGPDIKNKISHRAKALDAFAEWLERRSNKL